MQQVCFTVMALTQRHVFRAFSSGFFMFPSFTHKKNMSKWAIPELPCASVSLFHYENEFDLPQNEPVDSL